MMAAWPDDAVPLKRPHFALRGDGLFFLLSTRPHAVLDDVDRALWHRIDGNTPMAALRGVAPDADARVRRFHDLQLCEVAQDRFPSQRRRVLVIEPHMDDAILSAGGSMWALRDACEFTVATIAGRSNYTSYFNLDRDLFDVGTVSALRKAESALAMRLIGGKHIALDEREAPLRFHDGNWTLEWYRRHSKQVDAFIAHAPTEDEIEAWAGAVGPLLESTEANEIWMPLGVGSHTDHELARSACLRALQRIGPRLRAELYFYQDVPYATQFPSHTADIVNAMTSAGGRLTAQTTDVSAAALAAKLRLASVFGSQFKPGYMSPRVEEAARRAGAGGDGLAELRFRLTALPGPVDPVATYSGRQEVERVSQRLTSWYAQHRAARRIRILSPVPISRWKDDLTQLLDAFPRATLEVHVSDEYADETRALVSPRIEVRPVIGREVAWLGRLAATVIRPLPTILLTGEGLRRLGPIATALFAFSDPIVATRMTYFVPALRRITSS